MVQLVSLSYQSVCCVYVLVFQIVRENNNSGGQWDGQLPAVSYHNLLLMTLIFISPIDIALKLDRNHLFICDTNEIIKVINKYKGK